MADTKPGIRATDDKDLAESLWGENKRWDEDRRQYVPTVTEDEYTDAMKRHGTNKFSSEDSRTVRTWHEQRGRLNKEQIDEVAGKEDAEDDDPVNPADKGGASSPGSSTPTSSAATTKSVTGTRPDLRSTAPTTDRTSNGTPTAS